MRNGSRVKTRPTLPPFWIERSTAPFDYSPDSDLPRTTLSTATLYRPHPRQRIFHEATADEVLYGGAAGGGKSLSLLMDCGTFCAEHPRVRAALFRRTHPELWRTQVLTAFERFPAQFGGTYHHTSHEWRFPNGSVLEFCHAQQEAAVLRYQSSEYQRLAFDELTHFSEYQYRYMLSRLRSTRPGLPLQVKGATNPGGVGHAWVKERFIEGKVPEQPFRDDLGRSLVFIPARVDDNPSLMEADPAYVTRLRALPDAERRALLEGDWDVFAGQVFANWRRDAHVIRPRQLDLSWPRWRAIDYGTARPFVCLWLCQDPATCRVYVYREISRAGVFPASEQARLVADATRDTESILFTVADPAMWIRGETGRSVADEYASAGVPLEQAQNDRLSGLARVRSVLEQAVDGLPYLQVFETCQQLIRNLPALVYDAHRVEDVDTLGPDDEYDALRYGLMAARAPGAAAAVVRPHKRRMVGR